MRKINFHIQNKKELNEKDHKKWDQYKKSMKEEVAVDRNSKRDEDRKISINKISKIKEVNILKIMIILTCLFMVIRYVN